jgi:hypothetical protein
VKRIRGGATQPRVFVSFSHGDRDAVERQVLQPLKKLGVDVFSFADSIPPATDWSKLIEEELERCDWFVVVVSPRATPPRSSSHSARRCWPAGASRPSPPRPDRATSPGPSGR